MELICSVVKENKRYRVCPCNSHGAPDIHRASETYMKKLEEVVYFCIEHEFDLLHVLDLDSKYTINQYKIKINIGGRAI
jgi:hypothetical protein